MKLLDWFWAYDKNLRDGVKTSIADVDADGYPEIVTTPASESGPNMRLFEFNQNSRKFELVDWVMTYQSSYRGEIRTRVGDLEGDGDYEIIVTPQTNGGPNVRVYSWVNGQLELQKWFLAFDKKFDGGVVANIIY